MARGFADKREKPLLPLKLGAICQLSLSLSDNNRALFFTPFEAALCG